MPILPDKVFHFNANKEPYPYIVWAEENIGIPLMANDIHSERSVMGSVRYYTQTEYDEMVDTIQSALDDAGVSNALTQISFNPETDCIEYLWDWSVPCGNGKIY